MATFKMNYFSHYTDSFDFKKVHSPELGHACERPGKQLFYKSPSRPSFVELWEAFLQRWHLKFPITTWVTNGIGREEGDMRGK